MAVFAAMQPALALGFHHGLYCIGCRWAVMALLLAGGFINLVWIVALADLVLPEKVFAAR